MVLKKMHLCRKLWRDSASLMIVARNVERDSYGSNYKILVMKRSKKSFLPSLNVFPGGTIEHFDESKNWMDFYQSVGVPKFKLDELIQVKGDRPFIFEPREEHTIEREISLRICAIRETFEEVGLLFCKHQNEINCNSIFSSALTNFNRKYWQNEIGKDPSKFLELCQSLNVVPDIWNLFEWSSWLTPAFFEKRFDTLFFLVALNGQPELYENQLEAYQSKWESPFDLLKMFKSKEIILTAPQIYELRRLQSALDIDELMAFAKNRNSQGLPLLFAVNYVTKDKNIATFPGDDFYPKNPNFECEPKQAKILVKDYTANEFRQQAKNLHRLEYSGNDWTVVSNIEPLNGHLPIIPEPATK